MKRTLFLAACVAFTFSVVGCADMLRPTAPVSQKEGQSYKPYYQTPEGAPIQGQIPALPQGKLRAAILLPLSGSNAALGQAMLNAAQQAVFDAAEANFELVPRDTAADGGAQEAARAAIADGSRLIIGPLFASDVPAVKQVAQASGLMMLPLSTDTSLSQRGVFVMGLAPGAQVERIVAYAAAQGRHNFAALVPLTPYGNLVGGVFRRAVTQGGENLVSIEFFDPVARNAGEKIKALAAQRDNIDALFLPVGDKEMKSIANLLTAAGFSSSRAQILGTGLWDVPSLGRQVPFLVGSWYAAPDTSLRKNFITSYTETYNQEPPRLATLAYDATALASVLAKRGGRYDEGALTNPNGFAGLDGIFRLTLSGAVDRAMAVNEVTQDNSRVIDSAPTSFVSFRR